MRENILSVLIGVTISFFISFTGEEVLKVLFFSLIGGIMGFIGNTICRYILKKTAILVKKIISKFKKNKSNKK